MKLYNISSINGHGRMHNPIQDLPTVDIMTKCGYGKPSFNPPTRASLPDEQPLRREQSVVIIQISGRQHSELCGDGCRDMRSIHYAPNGQILLETLLCRQACFFFFFFFFDLHCFDPKWP